MSTKRGTSDGSEDQLLPAHVSRSALSPAGCEGMNSRTLTSIFMHDIKVFPERRCALTGGRTGDDTERESEWPEGAGVVESVDTTSRLLALLLA